MNAVLSIDGVSKRFRGLVAVDRVSCNLPRGEIFAVIGPNGAGKTTLFNMIAGALGPDEGTIAFQGERIDGLRPDEICRRGIARTFQIVRPFPALTVEDNVVVGALLRTSDTMQARAKAHDVMRRLDLFDKRARTAKSLTLPDRKRLEVARALATARPRLRSSAPSPECCARRAGRSAIAPATSPAGQAIASAILASDRAPRGGRFSRRSPSRKISIWARCCRAHAGGAR